MTPPQQTTQTTAANTPAQPVEPPPAPVIKPAPAKQKAQPQAKPAEQPGASAILPAQDTASLLTLPGTRPDNGAASPKTNQGTNSPAPGPSAAKTEEAAPPLTKSETTSPQNQAADPAPVSVPASPVVSGPAPAPAHEGDLVELGSVAELPKVVKKVDPIYPPAAQRVGREGNITINALIDEKGNVIDTSILKGIQDDKGLGRAAETALRKWKFQPAHKDGVAVKVWKPFVIAFKADANPAK